MVVEQKHTILEDKVKKPTQLVRDMIGHNDEYAATCPKCGHIEKSEIYWDKNKGKCAKCGYKE